MAGIGKTASNLFVWAILALLVVALAGFGIGNFGGSVRSVGAVGKTEIAVEDYARTLQAELRARQIQTGQSIPLSTPLGQQISEGVLRQLIATAALDGETARLGLSVGDATVSRQILEIGAFQGLDGQFSREAYAFALRQNGLTEDQFEAELRRETARNLTTAAVTGGVPAPEGFVDALAAYVGERRDALWLRLDADALDAPLPAPTEAELEAHYQSDPEAFTTPEARQISYVALTPEMVVGTISVDEAALQALYAERAAEYNRPERRLVERLVFPDEAAAAAARAALDAGGTSFEALVTGRGLTLADVDLGDVTPAELGAAGEAVFALEGPGIAGPVATPLGPALFRVNAVLAAQATPFEEVRDALTDELALDRARREIAAQRDEIDDLLAGGASLEEIAAETAMDFGTVTVGPDAATGIAAYAAFRDAAAAVGERDFPELLELEDGGLFALRLDALLPPALQPFEDVRDAVVAGWERAETEARLSALAERLRAAREAGESWQALGHAPEVRDGLARESFLDGAPEGLVPALFALEEGGIATIAEGGAAHLIELVRVHAADPDDPEAAVLRTVLGQNARQSLAQDVLDLFVTALEAEAGISLNQTAINAVHAQFP